MQYITYIIYNLSIYIICYICKICMYKLDLKSLYLLLNLDNRNIKCPLDFAALQGFILGSNDVTHRIMISGAIQAKGDSDETVWLFFYRYLLARERRPPGRAGFRPPGRAGSRPEHFTQPLLQHRAATTNQTEEPNQKKNPSNLCQAHWDPDKFSSDDE